jgi:hypothetical protein
LDIFDKKPRSKGYHSKKLKFKAIELFKIPKVGSFSQREQDVTKTPEGKNRQLSSLTLPLNRKGKGFEPPSSSSRL